MKNITAFLMMLVALVACSPASNDTDHIPLERKGAPVSFSIAVPTVSSTRIADPGSDAGEHDSWDHLLIIVAYTKKEQGTVFPDDDKKRMVYYDTFTKKEFDSSTPVEHTNSVLSPDTDHDGYHDFTMYLPTGDCHVYGITYSEGCGFDPVSYLNDIAKDGKDHNADITGMLITNDYAKGSTDQVAKMVSVATGYATYVDTSDPTSNGKRLLHISLDKENEMKQYWRMTLTRLATKVDIQWDAQSAYEPATSPEGVTYTDVRINQFVFRGGADATTGSGYGRLFPALAAQAATAAGQTLTPVGGDREFINTSEISRRNGRVYHYTFPDGTNSKKITFSLVTSTGIVKDKTTSYYTFDLTNLSGGFRRATWYKINVSIVGTKKPDGTVTISAFN